MSTRAASPTTVCFGAGVVRRARAAERAGLLVVADPAVRAAPPAVRIDAARGDLDAVREVAEHITRSEPRAVLAIGGGSVLDVVKLACAVHAAPGLAEVIEKRGRRCGLVSLPPTASGRPVRRLVAPTTLGTGTEVSAVACVRVGTRKCLVRGADLRPELALLDPDSTATLDPRLLREGVLEALLRVAGPVVGSSEVGGLPDQEAELLVRRLVAVGDRMAAGDHGPDARLTAATLSAATHTGWALAGREPYSAKHWYLANELATVAGIRKIQATVVLLPVLWRRVARGDRRLGYAEGLRRLAAWLDVPDAATGLEELVVRWDLGGVPDLPARCAEEVAGRARQAWGGPLPMLAGLGRVDLAEMVTEALEGTRCST